jgi:tryptophan synthase beta chain
VLAADDAELLSYDCEATLVHARRLHAAGVLDAEELAETERVLATLEGILPALEPAHAIGWLLRRPLAEGSLVLVNLSGRGDKDLAQITEMGLPA